MFEENKIEFKSEEDRKKFHDLIHAFDHHVKPDVDKNDSENEFDLVK